MSATLNRTVVAGGVIYPAGTASSDELREKIPNSAHWDEGGDPEPTEPVDPASAEPTDPPTPEDADQPVDYSTWTEDDVHREIANRNDGREDADRILDSGTITDLTAALELDDEAQREG